MKSDSFSSKDAVESSGLSNKEINELVNISKKASNLGGRILMKHYGKVKEINSKTTIGDLVTNADLEAEKAIIDLLKKDSPDITILAEESGKSGNSNSLVWCLDPLDGTTNFAHGYPFFGTSIGLTWNDVPILGSIDVPFLKENYWGGYGVGAFCNELKINVSSTQQLNASLLVTGFAYDRHTRVDNNYAEFCWLTHRTRGVRRGGAAAIDLAFVAAGRLDGYWERGLSKWDMAAGVAIVEAAGGNVCAYDGSGFDINSGKILATNNFIKDEMIHELSKVKPLNEKVIGASNLVN